MNKINRYIQTRYKFKSLIQYPIIYGEQSFVTPINNILGKSNNIDDIRKVNLFARKECLINVKYLDLRTEDFEVNGEGFR